MSGFDNSVLFVTKNTEGLQARFYYASDLSEEFDLFNSDGSPEGSIAANKGSICSDTTNGALYVKTTDIVNTGWSIITTGSGTVSSVTGTANRISIGGTASVPIVDIAATYIGQTSLTTLGTVTTGTWNGTAVGAVYGGTGQTTYATGDILYASAPNVLSKLSAGSNTQVLTLAAGVPTWATNGSGTGDVVGPASATDNALVRYDGTTGKLIQNGVITEDDTGNLSISAAVSGASLSATVANTSNTASATAFYNAQVAGGTASDAYYKAEISGGQAYTWGVDNSDSDAWVLSASATPGTTNVMRVSTAGEINYPLQPAFMAYLDTTVTNVTGDGTEYTVIYDTEVFDQGADFVLATSIFTAPVTGKYQMSAVGTLIGGTVMTTILLRFQTSNRVSRYQLAYNAGFTSVASAAASFLDLMDAADTLYYTVVATDTGGKVDDAAGTTGGQLRNWAACYLAV
jgi:hypothetical protein